MARTARYPEVDVVEFLRKRDDPKVVAAFARAFGQSDWLKRLGADGQRLDQMGREELRGLLVLSLEFAVGRKGAA